MDKALYDLMDWAGIEELVYSEASNPHNMLGAHMTEAGMLVQAFIPTARDITVKITSTGKTYQMELADDAGFFAALYRERLWLIIRCWYFMIMVPWVKSMIHTLLRPSSPTPT